MLNLILTDYEFHGRHDAQLLEKSFCSAHHLWLEGAKLFDLSDAQTVIAKKRPVAAKPFI